MTLVCATDVYSLLQRTKSKKISSSIFLLVTEMNESLRLKCKNNRWVSSRKIFIPPIDGIVDAPKWKIAPPL